MTTEAIASASLPRPESDLDGSSSYVPSLVSPTDRDSLDEGYDPDETLKVTVYDNEQIQFKSKGMFYESESSTESESEDDDEDVVVMYDNDNLNVQAANDDNEDVVYISSGNQSAGSQSREDLNANNVIQLHQSYDDSGDVELVNQEINRNIQLHMSYDDSGDVELITDNLKFQLQKDLTLEQLDNNSILEIEPSKFSMVKDASEDSKDENRKSIELVDIKHKVDYGELDKSASIDSNVKVCTDILKGINFDEISLSSLQNLREQNKKLRRMSNITSVDSDTKVFNEIWNAVKQDKFESQPNSMDSDNKVFQVLNKNSLSSDSSNLPIQSQTIPEESPISVHSWTMPENPGASPVYYPGGQVAESTETATGEKLVKMDTVESEKSIIALREYCTIRDGAFSPEVMISILLCLSCRTQHVSRSTVVILIVFVIFMAFMAFKHDKVTYFLPTVFLEPFK